jgi:hypothetical protein
MGTKNNPGTFDCYANAEPDEPMFILLGRDKHAAALVNLWVCMRQIDGEDPAKINEAINCANAMVNFVRARGKIPAGLAALSYGVANLAVSTGAHVSIVPEVVQPYAMGNYAYRIDIWKARTPA